MAEAYDALLKWARQAIEKATDEDLKKVEHNRIRVWYDMYQEDKPEEAKALNDEEKQALATSMEQTFETHGNKIEMFAQKKRGVSFKERMDLGAKDFAYFMEYRDKSSIDKGGNGDARIALSFDPKDAGKAFEAFAKYLKAVEKTAIGGKINQLKMMGADGQGNRTDSAVIYLNDASEETIKGVVDGVNALFSADKINLYSHVPFGMRTLEKGFATSARGLYSSSHGMARSKVIDDVVLMYQKNKDANVEELLKDAIKKNGYNLDEPANTDKDNYLKYFGFVERPMDEKVKILRDYLKENANKVKEYSKLYKEMGYEFKALEKIRNKLDKSDEEKMRDALAKGVQQRFRKVFGEDQGAEPWAKDMVQNQFDQVMTTEELVRLADDIGKAKDIKAIQLQKPNIDKSARLRLQLKKLVYDMGEMKKEATDQKGRLRADRQLKKEPKKKGDALVVADKVEPKVAAAPAESSGDEDKKIKKRKGSKVK